MYSHSNTKPGLGPLQTDLVYCCNCVIFYNSLSSTQFIFFSSKELTLIRPSLILCLLILEEGQAWHLTPMRKIPTGHNINIMVYISRIHSYTKEPFYSSFFFPKRWVGILQLKQNLKSKFLSIHIVTMLLTVHFLCTQHKIWLKITRIVVLPLPALDHMPTLGIHWAHDWHALHRIIALNSLIKISTERSSSPWRPSNAHLFIWPWFLVARLYPMMQCIIVYD